MTLDKNTTAQDYVKEDDCIIVFIKKIDKNYQWS